MPIIIGGLAIGVLWILAVAIWPFPLYAAGILAITFAGLIIDKKLLDGRVVEALRRKRLAHNADAENQLFLAGDLRGVYGDYEPAVDGGLGINLQPFKETK